MEGWRTGAIGPETETTGGNGQSTLNAIQGFLVTNALNGYHFEVAPMLIVREQVGLFGGRQSLRGDQVVFWLWSYWHRFTCHRSARCVARFGPGVRDGRGQRRPSERREEDRSRDELQCGGPVAVIYICASQTNGQGYERPKKATGGPK